MTLGNCGRGEMPKLREGTKMLRELDGSGRDIWQWEWSGERGARTRVWRQRLFWQAFAVRDKGRGILTKEAEPLFQSTGHFVH